jgi:hypothetical protein
MLAIFHAVAKWCHLFLGKKFFIKTNHLSPKQLFTQGTVIEEQHKWIDHLQAYDFEIIYKKGKEKIVLDVLA